MTINNAASDLIASQQQLENKNSQLYTELIRLSASERINQASSDAINALLSTASNTDARFLERAYENASMSSAMLNTASSTLDQASELAMQAEEISIRASSDTISDAERALLNDRYNGILENLDSLASSATFNGQSLFGESFSFFLGTESTDIVEVEIAELSTSALGLAGTDLSTVENATAAQTAIKNGLDSIISQQAALGNTGNTISLKADSISKELFTTNTSKIRINSPDSLQASVDLAKSLITQDPGTALQLHNQANLSAFLTSLS
ncbi:MAG: hypothetical protein KTR29_22195 [Rhodothermaceae bacterium]|nr:hypothetical protein [Rhodothermaceae bacterium]